MTMHSEILLKLPLPVMFVKAGQSLITYANEAASRLFALAHLDRTPFESLLADVQELDDFRAFSAGGANSAVFTFAAVGKCETGSFRAVVQRLAATDGAAWLISPLGDDSDASVSSWQIVQIDPLTGLPNRELLRDRGEQAIREAKRGSLAALAVLFVDLDRFKSVNDTYGHAAGDAVLAEAARRLRACLRDTDTVARLGGDEFVVLLSNLRSSEDAAIVAGRILGACSTPIVFDQNVFEISASVGIAIWPTDGETVDELVHNADTAMYSSKAEGRNTHRFFDPQMDERARERAVLESELRQALRDGNFVLHYQPQFCAVTRRIIGAEALIRWEHPTRGVIQPASFIPVAEETNLITPIGDWVLGEAVRQARSWKDQGLDLRVAVNLSGRQFVDTLPERVEAVLAENGIAPQLLELELTESFLVADTAKAVRILKSLRQLGVRVALDDFGTGWSSLSYLKNFPVDTLKIDRSFIGATPAEFDSRIIRAILAIAREFKLTTLAEGVETEEQLSKLETLGCESWQGFLLSGAVPADELTALYWRTEMADGRASAQRGAW
jgi:diguanylate cyclase (GGDEF)-like protein